MENPSQKRPPFLALFFALLLVGLGAGGYFYLKNQPQLDSMLRLSQALQRITNTTPTIEGHSLQLKTQDISELSVVERDLKSIIKYETQFFGVKKIIILTGKFKVKAGFNLEEATEFSMMNGKVEGSLPEAEILSVELLNYEVFHSQDAAFNKLTPKDQERATQLLLEQARKDAEQSDLTQLADSQFQQRLEDLMFQPQ